jgi:hypothetical protein
MKYGIEEFEEGNNFLYRNISRFKLEFELKFKEVLGFEIQYNLVRIFKN